ncbi:MAG: acyl carrier protein [Cyanobacteria bacterium P01_D01_bin.36]
MTAKTPSSTAQSAEKVPEKAYKAEEIREWLVNYMCRHLAIEPKEIDLDLEFDSFGLDSAVIIEMTAELEDYLGNMLDPTVVYEHHTINRLTEHLSTSTQEDVFWQRDIHT